MKRTCGFYSSTIEATGGSSDSKTSWDARKSGHLKEETRKDSQGLP